MREALIKCALVSQACKYWDYVNLYVSKVCEESASCNRSVIIMHPITLVVLCLDSTVKVHLRLQIVICYSCLECVKTTEFGYVANSGLGSIAQDCDLSLGEDI